MTTLARGLAAGGWAVALALLLALAPTRSQASTEEAAAFVETAWLEFLQLAPQVTGDPDADTELLRPFLRDRADLNRIARFTMGRIWREATSDQKSRYRDAVLGLMSRFLARRLLDVTEPKYEVVRTIDADRQGFVVVTRMWSDENPAVEVEWRVLADKQGDLRVVDFTVEGISMLVNYRGEVAALLDQNANDIDAVIEHIESQSGL